MHLKSAEDFCGKRELRRKTCLSCKNISTESWECYRVKFIECRTYSTITRDEDHYLLIYSAILNMILGCAAVHCGNVLLTFIRNALYFIVRFKVKFEVNNIANGTCVVYCKQTDKTTCRNVINNFIYCFDVHNKKYCHEG